MSWLRWMGVGILAGGIGVVVGVFAARGVSRKGEIEAFNQKYIGMYLKMDTDGLLATWEENGVDLMPGLEPMIGKSTIVKWVKGIEAGMPGYKVVKEEIGFQDIEVAGDWASEWGNAYQAVQPPEGKPMIESRGKIAFILHRSANGEWKVKQEMWNGSPKK
ncbi:MAG TPA: hypothetical protein VJN93_15230 [Candidatus Acidoferrum sp.]|nr:hypothetical protein [Candidatus Acidoferrum sp.]